MPGHGGGEDCSKKGDEGSRALVLGARARTTAGLALLPALTEVSMMKNPPPLTSTKTNLPLCSSPSLPGALTHDSVAIAHG